MGYRVINGKLYPVENLNGLSNNNRICPKENINTEVNFKQILEKAIDKENRFTISNHAAKRLESRDIKFSQFDMDSIDKAMNKAEKKGARECLILYKDIALITNIKNRTVITAVPKDEMSVFTNVDTVVLV
ncbi:TIGR02530 family flagellar biosynthesis protein [Haloimpatiens lingqiaonensis]|uniref:TIGR02530 family flagellar biosynthesis protein n=1 Tax=Haloimpatiens lingqiaonensis TaxID=1380675 RepID=UPI0010FE760B|nr:TIGR02530 family flagellar biosynthesis protein [Haloimpatiens lingqiaonensis]